MNGNDAPTSADYAWDAARTAQEKNRDLEQRICALEKKQEAVSVVPALQNLVAKGRDLMRYLSYSEHHIPVNTFLLALDSAEKSLVGLTEAGLVLDVKQLQDSVKEIRELLNL